MDSTDNVRRQNFIKYHESTGILRIDPSETVHGAYWIYLECCRDLGQYYRSRLLKYTCRYRCVLEPKFGPHVTVVRKEIITAELPKSGQEFKFQYSHEVDTNEKHFWMNVKSEELMELRESIGLPRCPWFPLHITIGVVPGADNVP